MPRTGTAPTQWFGGKQQLAPRIVALMPPHATYCEPYLGAGAVFFTKSPATIEVLNDADGALVNFFRVLRDPAKGARLREALTLTPYAREEWAAAHGGGTAADDVELARRWFVLTQMSFAGRIANGIKREASGWRFTVNPSHNPAASYCSAIDRLPAFVARLRNAQIEHDDALAVMARYDSAHTLMYLDPPYVQAARRGGGYQHEMSAADHEALLDLITAPTFASMVILSGYDSALYRRRLDAAQAGWQRYEVTIACSAAGRTRRAQLQGKGAVYAAGQTRTEVIWLNPAAQCAHGLWNRVMGVDEGF